MISKSVTHLRSYTNTAIAVNSAPISAETPASYNIAALDADIATLGVDVSASSVDIVVSNDECLMF